MLGAMSSSGEVKRSEEEIKRSKVNPSERKRREWKRSDSVRLDGERRSAGNFILRGVWLRNRVPNGPTGQVLKKRPTGQSRRE